MGPTSAEEIEKQHQEALRLVQEGMDCAPRVDHGEIPLSHKQRPTELLLPPSEATVSPLAAANAARPQHTPSEEEKKHSDDVMEEFPFVVSSRGQVEISKLQDLVREGYDEPFNNNTQNNKKPTPVKSKTNLWDPVNASRHNVHITRPSHDAWGIKKIVLVFCDDFLQTIYDMPWWHSHPQLQASIRPLLQTLHITPNQVVRLLLAAMPPNTTIPMHHDTGEWVKSTHRVHVPVLVTDPARVLFRCGATKDTLQRIDCTPGHIFELNNQSKHAVSNCGDDHRVHLILDYTRQERTDRIRLQPGERVWQTRRSVDRLVDRGTRPTPSFLILGAQKAGTTSLYEYMTQHPLVIPAKRRETHNLDWRWNDSLQTNDERRKWCLQFYYTKELQKHPSCLTGDSTPSYLLDALRVIPRLKQVFHHEIKFLVMLRDPVKRAHSHYAMVTSNDGTPAQIKTRGTEWRNLSFEEVVKRDMRRMQQCGLIPYWDVEHGVVNHVVFEDFVGSAEEDEAWNKYLRDIPLNTGSHSLISRGMYELNLRPWFKAFKKEKFLLLKLEAMKNDGIQPTLERVWRHLELPSYQVEDETAKNTRSYDAMDDDIQKYLEVFYEPHNRRLAVVLGDEWVDAWQHSRVAD